jgi:hypothetical protein
VLVNLLISSTEALTLAVAANDVAQFVKYHENGKKCVSFLRSLEFFEIDPDRPSPRIAG